MNNIHDKCTTNLFKVLEEPLHIVSMSSPQLGAITYCHVLHHLVKGLILVQTDEAMNPTCQKTLALIFFHC